MESPSPVSNASPEEIAERYHRAREAQAVWCRYTLSERVRRLRGLWEEIEASRESLIRVLEEETGKPRA
jgi:acyl-CoA reductase-like NAD-dependent aldehyde dehydrogenase